MALSIHQYGGEGKVNFCLFLWNCTNYIQSFIIKLNLLLLSSICIVIINNTNLQSWINFGSSKPRKLQLNHSVKCVWHLPQGFVRHFPDHDMILMTCSFQIDNFASLELYFYLFLQKNPKLNIYYIRIKKQKRNNSW